MTRGRLACLAPLVALLATGASGGCRGRDPMNLWGRDENAERPSSFRDRRADTLIVGRSSDVVSLDPALASDNESLEVCEQVYEHLVRLRADGQGVEPALALTWEVSDDRKAWTFQLRPGVRFHDGTPFDAEAVKLSFERQLDEHHPLHRPGFVYWKTNFASVVRAVEVLDPLTVRIHILGPYAPFLSSLALFPVSIVSPAALAAGPDGVTAHPVGTGPFRFVSWLPGDRVVLERWDGYWGEKPRLNQLVFKRIPDARQRLIALESGAIDVAYSLLPEELQFVELHPELSLVRAAGLNVAYLAMHTKKAPWDDLRVRRALNHAVNKVPIVKLVYQDNAVAAKGYMPPNLWGYHDGVTEYAYDPDEARRLLAEAELAGKFDRTRRYKLYAPSTPRGYLPHPERVARALARNLGDVGVDVELVLQPLAAHIASVQRGDHDLCLFGWSGDFADPDNFLYLMLSRDNAVPGEARNLAFYDDGYVSGLLAYAQETNDQRERAQYYRSAQERIAADAPWVPLAHSQITVATRDDVVGVGIHPSGLVYYQAVFVAP